MPDGHEQKFRTMATVFHTMAMVFHTMAMVFHAMATVFHTMATEFTLRVAPNLVAASGLILRLIDRG